MKLMYKKPASDDVRELDLASAISKVSYKVGAIKYEREYFAHILLCLQLHIDRYSQFCQLCNTS